MDLTTRVLVVLSMVLPAGAAWAHPVELVARGALPGGASDGTTFVPAVLEDGTPHDRAGGIGSAVTYTGVRNLYLGVPDRGPADGATSFIDRYVVLDLALGPAGLLEVKVVGARALHDGGGTLTGNASLFARRFDPEGVVLGAGARFYVSDEYGPFLYQFDAAGFRTGAVPLPAVLAVAHPAATAPAELPPANLAGRQSNRGMEGLAISPDGDRLFGMMQNALIQDGGLDPANKRVGLNNRLVEVDLRTGATRQFVYQLADPGNGVNELLAINEHQFLVLERDGGAGDKAKVKVIYQIDTSGATDVSDLAVLPSTGLPAGVVPVAKGAAPFLDLLAPAHGLLGPTFPEKIEGLTFGPDLPDGRRMLLVTSDNDFKAEQPTEVYAFAIAPQDLPGLRRQTLVPAVEVFTGTLGKLPVVIRGNEFLPVDAIERGSIRLAGSPPLSLFGQILCFASDGNGDGMDDLYCLIDPTVVEAGRPVTSLELTAQTSTGWPIRAPAVLGRE